MGKYLEAAMRVKPIFQKAAQTLGDEDALEVKGIYPAWEELVKQGKVEAEAGYKFTYDNKLFKCVKQNPTFQENWIPGEGTEALYTQIDETHKGTFNDPIPYDGNKALENGLYYSQDGIVYRCFRDTGIPVFNKLADLVGIYVEVVP